MKSSLPGWISLVAIKSMDNASKQYKRKRQRICPNRGGGWRKQWRRMISGTCKTVISILGEQRAKQHASDAFWRIDYYYHSHCLTHLSHYFNVVTQQQTWCGWGLESLRVALPEIQVTKPWDKESMGQRSYGAKKKWVKEAAGQRSDEAKKRWPKKQQGIEATGRRSIGAKKQWGEEAEGTGQETMGRRSNGAKRDRAKRDWGKKWPGKTAKKQPGNCKRHVEAATSWY